MFIMSFAKTSSSRKVATYQKKPSTTSIYNSVHMVYQCIMNRLYETEIQVDSIKQVNAAILSVLEGREPQFENMVQFFTENQFSLLKAIAKDSIVAQPTSGKFIKEHKLSGASSVKAALKILEDKELVYRTNEGYVIYDRFMDAWLKRI